MSLYNLKSADGQWRITKFTNDLEVESSYLTSVTECECPAGTRPSCRHRTMLPRMLNVGAEDSEMFYDFDHDQFLEPLNDSEDTQPAIVSPLEDSSEHSALSPPVTYEGAITERLTHIEEVAKACHPSITGTLKRRV
jgi:hypothetical protein